MHTSHYNEYLSIYKRNKKDEIVYIRTTAHDNFVHMGGAVLYTKAFCFT